MSAEEATVAFCVAESEAAVGMVSITEVVEITMGANVVELLVPPEAVWYRSVSPRLAVGMDVIVGVNVIESFLFSGGEPVDFDSLVG